MPDRSFIYRVEVDGRQAGPGAARIRRDIERELSRVRFTPQMQPSRVPNAPVSRGGGNGELIPGMGNLRNLAGLSIGGFAVTQMAQATLAAGKLGAENVRLARSYDALAKGAGLAGDVLVNKLSAATQQTVTKQTLMASTNMLLAASQEGQIAITEKQIATLAKFARLRSTQLTANGRPMSTEEAYGRLVQGIVKRETEMLDELGISTKQLADQLGVPLQQVNSDVESLLTAITQVAEIEIERFGEPIMDEAARIEQAATRIEEARNRINAALAGLTAGAYEAGAYTIEQMTFSGGNPYKEGILNDRESAADMFKKRSESALVGNEDFERMAQLLEGTDAAAKAAKPGVDALSAGVGQLAIEMANTAFVTDDQRAKLRELEVQLYLTNSGGIPIAKTTEEMGEAAELAASRYFKLGDALYYVSESGSKVQLPSIGPATGPNMRSTVNQDVFESIYGGTLIGSVLQGPGAFQKNYGSAYRQTKDEERRETEQAEREAIRNNASAWKSTAESVRQDFRGAAEELKSTIMSIPGLFGTSQVTDEQMKMAEWGVAQQFPDDIRRRLEDEVINGVDWGDIDPNALFGRAGIDLSLPDEAKMALFNQKWADSSLFADADNLDLLNSDAIRSIIEQQKMGELGQQNILGAFGIGEDSEGAYFTDLGGIIAGGMKTGAEEGLAEFGRDAIANVVMQLKTDSALTEYAALGGEIGGAIWGGVIESTGDSSIVSAIVTEVLAQINDFLPPE